MACTHGERGAALLLVLLLIPALSLVGIAILSMATREGERTRAQQQMAQSLYYAEGGAVRATWALITKEKLEKVGQQLPTGVAACTATEDGHTSGDVAWNGDPITITSTGTSGPYQRQVSIQFQTSDNAVDLKHVITTPGLVSISSPNPPVVSSTVNGPVWTSNANTDLSSVLGDHPVTVASIPSLDVDSKIDDIRADYNETVVTGTQLGNSSASSPYPFVGGASPGVYYTNDPGLWVGTSGQPGCISVQGECIWLIKNGALFGKDFTFTAVGPNARLIILITKNSSNNKGFESQKQALAGTLPIVLITDGSVDFQKECTFLDIAMYGSSITAAKGQDFAYDGTVLDGWMDDLENRGLLPDVQGGGNGTLTKVTGSWGELPQ